MRGHLRQGSPEKDLVAETAIRDVLPAPLFHPGPRAELITDPQGVISSVSPSAGILLRAAPTYLEGVPLRALVHRSDRPRLRSLLTAPTSEKAYDRATLRLAVPGGTSVAAEMTVSAARDTEGFVVGLCWRVHERRRARGTDELAAEPALRRRLQRLVASGHGVCLMRADGVVTWISGVALRMLGWKRNQVVGSSWAELVPEAGKDGRTPLQLALRRGREGSGVFDRVARADGTLTTLDYVVLPLLEDDRVLGAALAFTVVDVA
jgi:PAS domain S-box-containing protein